MEMMHLNCCVTVVAILVDYLAYSQWHSMRKQNHKYHWCIIIFFYETNINVPNPSVRTTDDISIPLIVLCMLHMDPSEGTILGWKPFNFGIQWEYLAVGFIRPK